MNFKIIIKLLISFNLSFIVKILNVIFKKIPLEFNKNCLFFCHENKTDLDDYLTNIDKKLFVEAKNINKILFNEAQKKINNFNFKLGGAANCVLLYFFTRYFKPDIIYETGVSYGYSSSIFLHAIKKNKIGLLYSSDLPYLKINNSQTAIGCLVVEELKKNWILKLNGDIQNAIEFNKTDKIIDLFHYDSDKSFLGKLITFNIIKKKLSNKCILIFDDIQTDNFFPYLVKKNNFNFKVFFSKNDNSYQGMIII